ncbi:hypothetical protein [Oryzisolibacter sp. LB2S]|uniref:hypothetical protein n=1 Tax=Alicycliphilus soli TaxID=3228789 RepID=UPI00345794A8
MSLPPAGDYGEPPDGDYARYVERLLQGRGAAHGAQSPAAAKAAPAVTRPVPAAARGTAKSGSQPRPAVRLRLSAKWPLLLWASFVLLMWFAPALLPMAIGMAVVFGVGYGVWKSRRGQAGRGHAASQDR